MFLIAVKAVLFLTKIGKSAVFTVPRFVYSFVNILREAFIPTSSQNSKSNVNHKKYITTVFC